MLFSLLYLLLRRALGAGRRPKDETDIELLVLRHQVKVLRRHVRRPHLRRLDRLVVISSGCFENTWPTTRASGRTEDWT